MSAPPSGNAWKPLSLVQRYALLDRYTTADRIPRRGEAVLRIAGRLDQAGLRAACDDLRRRHDLLRSVVEFDADGEARRRVLPVAAPPPAQHAITMTTEQAQDTTSLLRVVWDPVLLDEHSVGLLLDDLVAVYAARAGGHDRLPPIQARPSAVEETAATAGWAVTDRLPYLSSDVDGIAIPDGAEEAFHAVVAAVVVVLARYSRDPQIVLGVLQRPAAPDTLGAFAAPRGIRMQVAEETAFHDLTRAIEAQLRSPAAEDTGFALSLSGGRVLVRRDHLTGSRRAADDVEFHVVDVTPPPAPAELTVTLRTATPVPSLRVTVAPGALAGALPGRLGQHIANALAVTAHDPATPLGRVHIMGPAEHAEAIAAARGPDRGWNREPVHRQVAARASAAPDAVAVRFDGADLTYGELDSQANRFARHLHGVLGVPPGAVVAILLDAGPDALAAQLAVLKAGCAFVMADPAHPVRRIRYTLDDSRAAAVITRGDLVTGLDGGPPRLLLDQDRDLIAAGPATPPPDPTDEDSLAYLIYTSGSTGWPKGAGLTHGAMSNFLLWLGELFDLGADDRMLLHMALVFDFSHGEIFTALTRGATLVVASPEARTSPAALRDLLIRERVTYLGGTPSLIRLLDPEPYPDLRYLLVGGESIPGDLVERWNVPGRRLVSIYGPTETAVGCLEYECAHVPWPASPPIGHPTANRTVRVVDRWSDPAPVGVPGEIQVGGLGVGVGYLGHPALTAARFIPDPGTQGGRCYVTGDLGLRDEGGELHFLGRLDNQVKINGLRVELEEIEALLSRHSGVRQAVVVPQVAADGADMLVAFYTATSDRCEPAALREHLRADLPAHLVPVRFMRLSEFPLSSSGKVDRRALQDRATPAADRPYTPPGTWAEARVAEVFATVTGCTPGANDPFPSADPLLALRAVVLLERLTGTPLTVGTLLNGDSVATIAATLSHPATVAAALGDDELLALLQQVEALPDSGLA